MFQSAIDNNKRLSESENNTYLQTLVSGSAMNVYGCNPLFYKTTVDELRRRFGHPKHVVKAFISELQNFLTPHLSSSPSIRSFTAFLRKLGQTFENLHQFDSDLRSRILLEVAVAKLPAAVHMKWNEYNITSLPNGATFREFSGRLTVYARACEDMPETTKQSHRENIGTEPTTTFPVNKQEKNVSMACPFDNEKHHMGK